MFQGRYGMDKLNRALSIAAICFAVPTIFIPPEHAARAVLNGISLLLVALAVLRMFSRNFDARRRELLKYEELARRVKAILNGTIYAKPVNGKQKKSRRSTFEEYRRYKHLTCRQCGQKLRVPRGKGRLRVTCTRCGNKFEAKS